jgi:hypothetical protein
MLCLLCSVFSVMLDAVIAPLKPLYLHIPLKHSTVCLGSVN